MENRLVLRPEDITQKEIQKYFDGVAKDFTEVLRPVGDLHGRPGYFVGRVRRSLESYIQKESEGKNPAFCVDTITCPLYYFDPKRPEGDFSAITGVTDSLDKAPRYRNKFDRYLVTIERVNRFFRQIGIKTKGRIYFGDVGVINASTLKAQFGVDTDENLRSCLDQNAGSYESYLTEVQDSLGLRDVEFEFSHLSDILPSLKNVPIDLYESVDAMDVHPGENQDPDAFILELMGAGINSRVAEIAVGQIMALIKKRSVVKEAQREVTGFLIGYGLAGQGLKELASPPDLMVSLDPPGNYRNGFYEAFSGQRSESLATFIPHTLETYIAPNININRWG
ncbi:MAG: hypothetical protein Q7S61_03850 [bacterium]|nr:hypothetical protein [bacterium]